MSLAAVDSNGVRQEAIDAVERFRSRLHFMNLEHPTDDRRRILLTITRAIINQRDAVYIVELCLRVLLHQQERIVHRTTV